MNDDRLEPIADFLCNGIEHGSGLVNRVYLVKEFGLTETQADRLLELGNRIRTDTRLGFYANLLPLIKAALK